MNIENPLNKQLNKSPQPNLDDQVTNAESAIQRYAELTREVRETGRTNDPEYSQKREKLEKEMDTLSLELEDRFGVKLTDQLILDSKVFNKGIESVLLGKAIDVAKEAKTMNFEKNLSDAELIEEAKRLVEDFKAYVAPMIQESKHPDPNYSTRYGAKRLLIESLARELAKRLNVGDGIEVSSVIDLSRETGVDFSKVVREVHRAYSAPKVERESSGRRPQIGATGTWKTPGGYVGGKVIFGRIGGPYVIETPQGNIQVDRIE